ncbi:MAG: BatD family protein [Ferruginibacter sp.]
MNLFLRKILLICTFFFVYAYTNAQVNFTATTFPSIINKEDSFTYKIIFANADTVGSLSKPDLRNFIILSGPTRLNELKKLDGKLMRYATLEYHLKPKMAGSFIIDPLFATINYKKYKSNAVAIIVNDPTIGEVQRPDTNDYIFHKGDSLADKINKNMILRIEVDKKSCFVGEPIIAKFKLYARLKNTKTDNHNSSFNGFSVADIISSDSIPQNRGKLNNRDYNISTLRMAQLYPLQAGLINLESAQLETTVSFVKEEYANQIKNPAVVYDYFVKSRIQPENEIEQTVTLKSEAVDINVKPLPEKNKPVSFKGSVGSFQIIAGIQKPLFSTDETGKLSVTIVGSGNMLLLTAPDIDWPKGIESFDPKFSENITGTTVPISGSKRFEYSFSANDSGHYTIPPINFSFFDPLIEDFKTVSTDPIIFQVSKGDGKPVDLSHFNIIDKKISFLNNIFNHRWWVIIFIAVVMFSGIFMWLINDKRSAKTKLLPVVKEEDIVMNKFIETSAINQQNVFSKTETCMNQDDCFRFYTLLNIELKNYLVHKFSFDLNAINSNTIEKLMDKKGIANDIALKLFSLMQNIEWQLYTPFERNEKMNELYSEAHEIVQLINTATATHL